MKRRVPLVRIDLGTGSGGDYLILTDVVIDDANGNLWSLIGSHATTHDHREINFIANCNGAKIQTATAERPKAVEGDEKNPSASNEPPQDVPGYHG